MKKLLTILVLIMLIISFFQITSMYALYKEMLQSKYTTLLGAWEIRVNAKDVTTSGQVETFTIATNQLGYVNSEYIQAGKIAPGGQAYFDIVIDPSNVYKDAEGNETTVHTDVSIIYTIDVNKDAISSTNPGLEFADAIELVSGEDYFGKIDDEGKPVQVTNDVSYKDGNTYTAVIPLSKIKEGYKNYIRLYFKWKNVTETVKETITVTEMVDGVETEVEKEVSKEVETNNEQDTALGTTANSKLSIPIEINLKQYTGERISGDAS